MFARVIAGSAPVLTVAPLATLLGLAGGTTLGLITGYYRGWVDDIFSRIVDALLAFPLIIMAVLVLASLGRETRNVILVIGIIFTPLIARTVRSAVLVEREREYVAAARLRGERGPRIMVAEILPNITGPILVEGTIRLGYAIFAAATLAFLGLGIQDPSPDWGLAIATAAHTSRWRGGWCYSPPRAGDPGRQREPRGGRPAAGDRGMIAADRQQAVRIEGLTVAYRRRARLLRVLDDVSFSIGAGEAYGLVGESGCGKTTVAMSLMRYLPDNAEVEAGRIMFGDEDVLTATGATLRKWRGDRMAMVYQDPGSALNPSIKVGEQIAEVYRFHKGMGRSEALAAAVEMLSTVQISAPTASCAATRTSSRAASSSGSCSRWRSPRTPTCSCWTSRRRASTPPSRRRCSTWSSSCDAVRHVDPLRQPQPRHRGADVRAGRGALRRAG